MGLGLPKWVYKDADAFPYATQVDSAVPDGLLIWQLAGLSDIERARRNFATGDKLAVVGSPTVGATYITGSGGVNYLKAGVLEPEEFTICAILKQDDTNVDDANRGVVCASFGGALNLGLLISWNSATTLRCRAYQAGGVAQDAILTPSSPTTLKRYTWTCSATTLTAINETDSATATDTFTAARAPGALPMSILSANVVTYQGDQGFYSFALWNRVLSPAERAAHWAQMALHAARDGVVVA
jgi:hypothetical protein